jgi:hypothetical protein
MGGDSEIAAIFIDGLGAREGGSCWSFGLFFAVDNG